MIHRYRFLRKRDAEMPSKSYPHPAANDGRMRHFHRLEQGQQPSMPDWHRWLLLQSDELSPENPVFSIDLGSRCHQGASVEESSLKSYRCIGGIINVPGGLINAIIIISTSHAEQVSNGY